MKYIKFFIVLALLSSLTIFCAVSNVGSNVSDATLAKLPNTARYNVRFINNTDGDIQASALPVGLVAKYVSVNIKKGQKGYVTVKPCISGSGAFKITGLSGVIKGKTVVKNLELSSAKTWEMDCRWGGLYVYVTNKPNGTIEINKITDKKGKDLLKKW